MNILIVDDKKEDLYLLDVLLKKSGYQVIQALNGKEALKKLRADGVKMIISDILMPAMDGFELCKQVRADDKFKDILFVFYTATYTDEADEKLAMKLGADKFIRKPTDPDEFTKMVEGVIEHVGKGKIEPQKRPVMKREEVFKLYSERLVNKLEQKMLELTTEVTERKRTEEALRKFSHAVEQSPATIMITDARGNIEYVNPKFTEVTGYTREEVLGKNPRILQSGETSPAEYQRLWLTITAGKEWRGEFQNKKKNGELYWEFFSISPIKNEQGVITHFVAVKEDTTERKQLQEQLLQAQKMETIGTLAGGVAHDFNNLLTTILGNAEFGLEDLRPDAPGYEHFIAIKEAANRASDLTNQLLSFSRRQVLKKKILNLNRTIEDLLKMLRRILGEDIELRVEFARKLAPVYADPGQVQQVLMNLFANARDAMPKGGKLMLKTRNVKRTALLDEPKDRQTARKYVQIVVADTGTGIEKENLAHIFDPFYTTKEVGKGTGLGLAVVHGIVEQHGGNIEVDSRPGEGTTVEIFFPAVKRTKATEDKPEPAHVTRGRGETLLLVEDEAVVLGVTVRILNYLGYKVLTARDGEEAMNLFQSEKNNIDLVILDVVMPKESGPDIYKKMTVSRPNLPVLFVTGYDVHAKLADFGLETEPRSIAVLQKPYTRESLGAKIRELLSHRQEKS
ncbi:MAG: response regulator [bacterium]